MIDKHPLHTGLITNAPGVTQVDELSRRVHTRDGRRADPNDRALPRMSTTKGDPRWGRFGRAVDRPRTDGTPKLYSPSELEPPRRGPEQSHYGTLEELIARLR